MKIQPVPVNTTLLNRQVRFEGIWGRKHFIKKETNTLFDCNYYNIEYFPFKDETTENIQKEINRVLDKKNAISMSNVKQDLAYGIISCTQTVANIMNPLSVTRKEYKNKVKYLNKSEITKFETKLKNMSREIRK